MKFNQTKRKESINKARMEDFLRINKFSNESQMQIDYVLYFETSLIKSDNDKREAVCKKFLEQLECYEEIHYEKINYNYSGYFFVLNASEEKLLVEAEKCGLQFYLDSNILEISKADFSKENFNKIKQKTENILQELTITLILSCLKDMKAKSYMINFQSDRGKDRKSKIENVLLESYKKKMCNF